MIVRRKVEDARGRMWVRGLLDSDDYFDEVRSQARERARREVAAQLAGLNGNGRAKRAAAAAKSLPRVTAR